jgi:O-antigen/teichoic acid export membrane protein
LWKRQWELTWFFSAAGLVVSLLGFWLMPYLHPMLFGPAFYGAAVPGAFLITSKMVGILTGIFYYGLMTDHRYDVKVCLTMAGAALFSLGLNLLWIPHYGMLATSIINLSSEVLIFIVFIIMSCRRRKSLRRGTKESG